MKRRQVPREVEGKTPQATRGQAHGLAGVSGRFCRGLPFAILILATATMAANAQERLPLQLAPEDRGLNIEKIEGGIRLSPSGDMLPLSYRYTPNVTNSASRWSAGPAPADLGYVYHRSLTVTNALATAAGLFYRAAYPDFSKINGFVRLPPGVASNQLTTLVVTLHPTLNVTNAGLEFEQELGPVCDQYGLVSYFPSALAIESKYGSVWHGLDGAHASDYASVLDGIKACERSIPTIQRISLAAYSLGVDTAIGLAQMHPEKFAALLLISGRNNLATTRFVENLNGGAPVRFGRPLPVVALASPRDELSTLAQLRTACKWFAAANGFSGDLATNVVRGDYIKDVPGVDGSVVSYGDHVRLIIHDAKNHWDSTFLSDAGFDATYRDFLRDGKLPGGE